MTTYAVGDIQGCCGNFDQLLEKLKFNPTTDRLWIAGDITNRGPTSLPALRRVMDLGDNATTVIGNHDIHLLSVMCGLRKSSAKDTLDDILDAPDRQDLLDWLRHQPLLHHDEALGYTMVHAGLHPAWNLELARQLASEVEAALRGENYREFLQSVRSDKPTRWKESLEGIERLRFAVNCFTRMRYCRESGKLDLEFKGPPDKAPEKLLPWYAVPERQNTELKIVFGHWASHGESTTTNVFPLDFGCVWGGSLRALALETGDVFEVSCEPPL